MHAGEQHHVPLPQLTMHDLHHRLSNLNNFEIILAMWTSQWCEACHRLEPELVGLKHVMKNKPVTVVKVPASNTSDTYVNKYIKEYDIKTYPSVTIFRKGEAPHMYTGHINAHDLETHLNYLFEGKTPPVVNTAVDMGHLLPAAYESFDETLRKHPFSMVLFYEDGNSASEKSLQAFISASKHVGHNEIDASLLYYEASTPGFKDILSRYGRDEAELPLMLIFHWRDYTIAGDVPMSRQMFLDATPDDIYTIAYAINDGEQHYHERGSFSPLESLRANIWDVHSLSSLQKQTHEGEATWVLIYDRGGYVNEKVPISTATASEKTLALSKSVLRAYSEVAEMMVKEDHMLRFLRLDRMEERIYEQIDLQGMLQLKSVPAICLFTAAGPYDRIPYVIPSKYYGSTKNLREAMKRALHKMRSGEFDVHAPGMPPLHPDGVLQASEMSPEELARHFRKEF